MPARQPLFTAVPRLPRNDITDPAPEETSHPSSLTAKLRRFLLNDGEALFTAKVRQIEYERKVAADSASANEPRN